MLKPLSSSMMVFGADVVDEVGRVSPVQVGQCPGRKRPQHTVPSFCMRTQKRTSSFDELPAVLHTGRRPPGTAV